MNLKKSQVELLIDVMIADEEMLSTLENEHNIQRADEIGPDNATHFKATDKDKAGNQITFQTKWMDLKQSQLKEFIESILLIQKYPWEAVAKELFFDIGNDKKLEKTVMVPKFLAEFGDILGTDEAVKTEWLWRLNGNYKAKADMKMALAKGISWSDKADQLDNIYNLFKEAIRVFRVREQIGVPKNVWNSVPDIGDRDADARRAAQLVFTEMSAKRQDILLFCLSLWLPVIANTETSLMTPEGFTNLMQFVLYDDMPVTLDQTFFRRAKNF